MLFAYKTEDLMALNLDTPLIFHKTVSKIVSLSMYIIRNKPGNQPMDALG